MQNKNLQTSLHKTKVIKRNYEQKRDEEILLKGNKVMVQRLMGVYGEGPSINEILHMI